MKLKLIGLLIVSSLLTACANTVYKTELEVYCPPLKQYTESFNRQLSEEIGELEPSQEAIVVAVSDYVALRDQIRACEKARDSIKRDK